MQKYTLFSIPQDLNVANVVDVPPTFTPYTDCISLKIRALHALPEQKM